MATASKTGSIDLGALNSASKTATNHFRQDATGLRIANADPATATTYQHQTATSTEFVVGSAKRTVVDANGLTVYLGASGSETDMAHFGTFARIGSAYSDRVVVDSTDGVTIYKGNTKRLKTTANGIDVYGSDGSTSIANFGPTTRIGGSNAAHVVVAPTYLAETSPSGDNLFEVGRILDDDGYAEYVQTVVTPASVSVFSLDHYGATIKGYSYDGQTGTVTVDPLTVSVNGAETNAYTLSMVAEASGDVVHVTLNTATSAGDVVQIAYRTTASSGLSMQFGVGAQATGDCSAAFGVRSVASGIGSFAEGGYYTVSGDIATYHQGGTAKGNACHAEGYETLASGLAAHAEGYRTTASGIYSHTEGERANASGHSAHAEGFGTTASGSESHAEGDTTTASGNVSHAEGYRTTASGGESHAEGFGTTAGGYAAHAQNFYTTADYSYQTAIGQFNDNQSTNAFEIGNGSSSAHSNALAVDWSGNVTASGEVTGTVSSTVVTLSNNVSADGRVVRRMGNLVTVYLVNVNLASALANNSSATIGTVPSGYRPPNTAYANLAGYQNGGSYITITSTGSVDVHNYSGASIPTSRNLAATFTYVM